jgi:hypothetical protein
MSSDKSSHLSCINNDDRPSSVRLLGGWGISFWTLLIQEQLLNIAKLLLGDGLTIKRSKRTDSNLQFVKYTRREDLLPLLSMFIKSCSNLCSFTYVQRDSVAARCTPQDCIQPQLSSFWSATRFAQGIESSPLNLVTLCCHNVILGEV